MLILLYEHLLYLNVSIVNKGVALFRQNFGKQVTSRVNLLKYLEQK